MSTLKDSCGKGQRKRPGFDQGNLVITFSGLQLLAALAGSHKSSIVRCLCPFRPRRLAEGVWLVLLCSEAAFPARSPWFLLWIMFHFFVANFIFFPNILKSGPFLSLTGARYRTLFLSLCKTSALSAQSYNVGKRGKKYYSMMAHFFIKKCGEDPADIIQRGPGMMSRRFCRNFGEVFSKRFSRDLVLVLVGKSCGDLGRVLSERSLRKIWLLPCSRGACMTVVLRCSYSFFVSNCEHCLGFPRLPQVSHPYCPVHPG